MKANLMNVTLERGIEVIEARVEVTETIATQIEVTVITEVKVEIVHTDVTPGEVNRMIGHTEITIAEGVLVVTDDPATMIDLKVEIEETEIFSMKPVGTDKRQMM